jgi:hypothetical protein
MASGYTYRPLGHFRLHWLRQTVSLKLWAGLWRIGRNCSVGWLWSGQAGTNVPLMRARMAVQGEMPRRRAVPVTDRYPAWLFGPQVDLKPLVTLRKTTEGRISRSQPLLVAGTRGPVMKTKNLPRQALICRCRSRPAGWSAGLAEL